MICNPRALTLLKPVPCPVCGGRERTLIGSPMEAHMTVVPCLACVWRLPIHCYPREAR